MPRSRSRRERKRARVEAVGNVPSRRGPPLPPSVAIAMRTIVKLLGSNGFRAFVEQLPPENARNLLALMFVLNAGDDDEFAAGIAALPEVRRTAVADIVMDIVRHDAGFFENCRTFWNADPQTVRRVLDRFEDLLAIELAAARTERVDDDMKGI